MDDPGMSILRSFPDLQWRTWLEKMELSSRSSEISGRLGKMRDLMAQFDLDFYIIPSQEDVQAEKGPECDRLLECISGFTGLVGQAIIMKQSAYFFTDSEHWIQAQREINCEEWTMVRYGFYGAPRDWMEWLGDRIVGFSNSRIGINARLISCATGSQLLKLIENRNNKCSGLLHVQQLLDVQQTFVDLTTGVETLMKCLKQARIQSGVFAYGDPSWKLRRLRNWIRKQGTAQSTVQVPSPSQMHIATFIDCLDSIANILNLHRLDAPHIHLSRGCLFVSLDEAILFVDAEEMTQETSQYLDAIGMQRREYGDIPIFIRQKEWGTGKVLLSPQTSFDIAMLLTLDRVTFSPSHLEYTSLQDKVDSTDGLESVHPLNTNVLLENFVDWMKEKDVRNNDGIRGGAIKVYATKPSEWPSQKQDDIPPNYTRSEANREWNAHKADSISQNSNINNDDWRRGETSTEKTSERSSRKQGDTPRSLTRSSEAFHYPWKALSRKDMIPTDSDTRPLYFISQNRAPPRPSLATPLPPPPTPKPLVLPNHNRIGSNGNLNPATRSLSTRTDSDAFSSTTKYSHASSRTVSTDYGIFHTRSGWFEDMLEEMFGMDDQGTREDSESVWFV